MAELTAQQIEAERVKFEAWASGQNRRIDRSEGDKEHNSYQSATTTFYWWGWLGRASEVADQGEARPAQAPAGWKLVPIEPSDEMLDAAWAEEITPSEAHSNHGVTLHIWDAMLAAAPAPKGTL